MRIRWLVPSLPMSTFQNGLPDLHFAGTVGWCWEEVAWAGRFTGPGDQLIIGDPGHNLDIEMPDAVVVSPEGLACQLMAALMEMPKEIGIFLRCVCTPSVDSLAPVWTDILSLVPKLRGIAVLGELEKEPMEVWSRRAKYTGDITIIPLGAEEPSRSACGRGVAYLGRLIPDKRVSVVIEAAKRLPHLPFYLAAPLGTEHQHIKNLPPLPPNMQLISCGISGRAKLLQHVRVVATASVGDSQWLPGTEIRGAGGVALAARNTHIEAWNGDGLLYFDGSSEDLARSISALHDDDDFFRAEAQRQHRIFLARGLSSNQVGKSLWQWVTGRHL